METLWAEILYIHNNTSIGSYTASPSTYPAKQKHTHRFPISVQSYHIFHVELMMVKYFREIIFSLWWALTFCSYMGLSAEIQQSSGIIRVTTKKSSNYHLLSDYYAINSH